MKYELEQNCYVEHAFWYCLFLSSSRAFLMPLRHRLVLVSGSLLILNEWGHHSSEGFPCDPEPACKWRNHVVHLILVSLLSVSHYLG